MRIVRTIEGIGEIDQPTAVAIGIFDGLHKGHQRVIARSLKIAKEKECLSVVLTFRTFGDTIHKRNRYIDKIISESIFFDLLEKMGVDMVVALPFEQIRELSAEEFVFDILKNVLNAQFVSCGSDFHFGKNASGDIRILRKIGSLKGIDVEAVRLVVYQHEPISSTRIRASIAEGNLPTANDMLGHRYSIDFKVVGGKRIGRTLGTPTINQPYPDGYVIPKLGVYATLATIEAKQYTAVTNVGHNPTVGGVEGVIAETYIQDFAGNLYGENVKVEFLQFLRSEQKFGTLEELRERIHHDSIEARNIGAMYLNY